MKRSLGYLVALLIVLVCVYSFWVWLQYKGSTVIKQTTTSILTQLHQNAPLSTVSKTLTTTISGEQSLTSLLPNIGAESIINSALLKDNMSLTVTGIVHAGYSLDKVTTGDIQVSRDGTVSIFIGVPDILDIELTGTTKTTLLGITTQQDIDLENTLRQKAKDILYQDALSGGILDEAQKNAQNMLQDIILKAGIQIKEVIILGTGSIANDVIDGQTGNIK